MRDKLPVLVLALVFISSFVVLKPSFADFTNGSFDSSTSTGLSPWVLNVKPGTEAAATLNQDVSAIDGSFSAKVNVSSPSATDWYAQLSQRPISLQSGVPTTFSFWAKADTPRKIRAAFQLGVPPYNLYNEQSFDITTTWQKYTYQFTPNVTDASSLFSFNLASTAGNIWIDKVTLENTVNCPSFNNSLGSATSIVDVSEAGKYRVWSRIKPTDSVNNSFYLKVGDECVVNVGDSSNTSSDWNWVDYKDGNSENKIEVTLPAGSHVVTLYGKEPGVGVDKIIMTKKLDCIPEGLGTNCSSLTSTPTLTTTPTPSPTFTVTPSPTRTPTPTFTPTPTLTPTPTPKPTNTPTPKPTPTPTPKPTATLTPSPTSTPIPTSTLTPTPRLTTSPLPTPTTRVKRCVRIWIWRWCF